MKKKTLKNYMLTFCISILIFFMFTIFLRFFTKKILIDKLNISNSFTDLVFFDTNDNFLSNNSTELNIDWADHYPFSPDDLAAPSQSKSTTITDKISDKISAVEEKLNAYTQSYLVGYQNFITISNKYKVYLDWNIASVSEYNGVVELADGYLTDYEAELDMTEHIQGLSDLYNYCQQENINFLYVQSPHKINSNFSVSGAMDFSNQNADVLLSGLKKSNVPYLDMRTVLNEANQEYLSFFYKTDHHWKAETGLLATSVIADRLNKEFNYDIDLTLFSENSFEKVIYEDCSLGSHGRKVTLARAKPEDICLFYPNYPTSFHYSIPNLQIDTDGSFSVVYDMSKLETKSYYEDFPYSAYNYGDRPLIQISNRYNSENCKILFIKDSFVDCVAPFMALGVKDVDVLDPRYFNGSVKNYIETTQPNVVIVMYYPGSFKAVDLSTHRDLFDFR